MLLREWGGRLLWWFLFMMWRFVPLLFHSHTPSETCISTEHIAMFYLSLDPALMTHKLTSLPKLTVPRQPSHRVSTHGPCARQPDHPLRKSQLRRDRIRQRGRPGHLGLSE